MGTYFISIPILILIKWYRLSNLKSHSHEITSITLLTLYTIYQILIRYPLTLIRTYNLELSFSFSLGYWILFRD